MQGIDQRLLLTAKNNYIRLLQVALKYQEEKSQQNFQQVLRPAHPRVAQQLDEHLHQQGVASYHQQVRKVPLEIGGFPEEVADEGGGKNQMFVGGF